MHTYAYGRTSNDQHYVNVKNCTFVSARNVSSLRFSVSLTTSSSFGQSDFSLLSITELRSLPQYLKHLRDIREFLSRFPALQTFILFIFI